MKNKLKLHFELTSLFILGFSCSIVAQSNYKISNSKEVEMKMSGTSTLHDWVMNAQTVSGAAQFKFNKGNDKLTTLQNLTFNLLVLNLKSENKELNNNAYKALKSDLYKNISYKLTSSTITTLTKNKYNIKTLGNLTIAGVTNEIMMEVTCIVKNDETITCNGTYILNMTDYKIKTPTFMLGVVKTGDLITLDFNMIYQKQSGS